MRAPKVSVLMSVHNGADLLGKAIEGILAQTLMDLEFIIVDDSSTDLTPLVLEKYATTDQRIRTISNETNLGLTRSLNRALSIAQGHYVARQDADDISFPHRLEIQAHFLDQHEETGAVGSAYEVMDEEGRVVGRKSVPEDHESLRAHLMLNNPFCHSTLMARGTLLKQIGGYNEQRIHAQDYDLWWRLGSASRLAGLPQVLVRWRRGGRVTQLHREEQLRSAYEVSRLAVQEALGNARLAAAAYEMLWWALHGDSRGLQWNDVRRLSALWEWIAAHGHGATVWGRSLRRLGIAMVASRRFATGFTVIWVCSVKLGHPMAWGELLKGILAAASAGGRRAWEASVP